MYLVLQVQQHSLPHPKHYKPEWIERAILPDLAALVWSACQVRSTRAMCAGCKSNVDLVVWPMSGLTTRCYICDPMAVVMLWMLSMDGVNITPLRQ